MPRSPTKTHVLRSIRERLGLSQVTLAKKIGMSAVSIKKFENHTVPISENAAALISQLTGADKRQLLENSQPDKPRNYWGEPLTKEWFEAEYKKEADQETVDGYVGFIAFQIRIALDACATVHPKEVHTVIMAFVISIAEITDKFGLRPMVRELMTKFISINADDPFAAEKIRSEYGSPSARTQYYADLEEQRILKTRARAKVRSANKPTPRAV